MNNILQIILPILQSGAFVASSIIAILAWRTYSRNHQLRRVEWLLDLHHRFYEEPHYKEMRSVLDYKKEPEYSKLRDSILHDKSDLIEEKLVDYLNFFEFVAGLYKNRQLKLEDVRWIFKYYLRNLAGIDFVRNFVRTQDFERLESLLRELDQKPC